MFVRMFNVVCVAVFGQACGSVFGTFQSLSSITGKHARNTVFVHFSSLECIELYDKRKLYD